MKSSIRYLLTTLIIITSSLSYAGQIKKVFGDWYKFNNETLKFDIYHPIEEDLLSGNTNYIQNVGNGPNQVFNVSSGTVNDLYTTTITFSDHTVQTTAFNLLTLWDTDIDGNLMPSNSILANDSYWEINIDNDLIPKP